MQHFRPTKDRRSLWRLLQELANPQNIPKYCDNCLEQVLLRAERGAGTGALIFVIADLNREIFGLEQRLVQLRQKHSVVLVPVDDPALIGGVLRAADRSELRIDVTQHQMHAVILARRYVYPP